MCTFKITNNPNPTPIEDLLCFGGPDTNLTVDLDGAYLTHYLLSITGTYTPQPVLSAGKYYMLLGEIYNWDTSLPSDIFYGIQQYQKHGENFTQYLDGEYLFIVADPGNKTLDIFTDTWSTRQIYYYDHEGYWYFSTFPMEEPASPRFRKTDDPVWSKKYNRLSHNTHYRFNYSSQTLTVVNPELHKWNLDQTVDNLDLATEKFEQAILKRYKPDAVLFLSGGYDSTCIAACLTDHKLPFQSITLNVAPAEDTYTLADVLEYSKNYNTHYEITQRQDWVSDLSARRQRILNNTSMPVQNQIREESINRFGNRVILMGNGSDEMLENYIFKGKSEFTSWPTDLKTVFPWQHFYGGQSRRLLDYHETVSLGYGMEVRNVFYDTELVQSWINTTSSLKNTSTKPIQTKYLDDRAISIPVRVAGFGSQHPGYNNYG